ncbi:hypothetical protein BSKO_02094 [Bryopsis sp. KO-2023]|nr:hypothetical protein BSKO_02094 [Bryopsis sp. KO-2023]
MSVDVSLYQRLDEQLASLTDNFCNMVRSSLLPEEDDDVIKGNNTHVPGELPEVFASKILHNAQTALNLVSELKKSAMHSDVTALTHNSRTVKRVLEGEAELGENRIASIRKEAEETLMRLEEQYYSSKHKRDAPDDCRRQEAVWEEFFIRGLECDRPKQQQTPKPESAD